MGECDSLLAELRALKHIPGVIEVVCSTNMASTEHHAALTVDVEGVEALAAYREHPDHLPVLERLRSLARRLEVADIEAP